MDQSAAEVTVESGYVSLHRQTLVNIQSSSKEALCFKLCDSVEISVAPKQRQSSDRSNKFASTEWTSRALTFPLDNMQLGASIGDSDVFMNSENLQGNIVKLSIGESNQCFGVLRHDCSIPDDHVLLSAHLQSCLKVQHLCKIRSI